MPAVLAHRRKTCLAESPSLPGKFFSLQSPGQDLFPQGSQPPSSFFSRTPEKSFPQSPRPISFHSRRPANFFPLKAPSGFPSKLSSLLSRLPEGRRVFQQKKVQQKEGASAGLPSSLPGTRCLLNPFNPLLQYHNHHHQAEAEIFSLEASGQAFFSQDYRPGLWFCLEPGKNDEVPRHTDGLYHGPRVSTGSGLAATLSTIFHCIIDRTHDGGVRHLRLHPGVLLDAFDARPPPPKRDSVRRRAKARYRKSSQSSGEKTSPVSGLCARNLNKQVVQAIREGTSHSATLSAFFQRHAAVRQLRVAETRVPTRKLRYYLPRHLAKRRGPGLCAPNSTKQVVQAI